MSTVLQSPPTLGPAVQVRPALPRLAPWAIAGVVAAVLAALFLLTDLGGRAIFIVLFVPLFVAALTAVSARVEGRRRATDRLVTALVYGCFGLAVLPLVSVLGTTVVRGIDRLDLEFLTHSMNGITSRDPGGGAYHAMVGTVQQVGLATVMAVPIGLLTAIYLVEYGRGRLARAVTFFVDVMTGVPSIVAGLFIYTLFIFLLDFTYAGIFGALALAILMLPVVVRSAEEVLRLVPNDLREASLALGVPRWRTILKVVVPTAFGGIITGIMLAIARVTGETAPLLLTVFNTDVINFNPFSGPQIALPQYVFNEIGKGLRTSQPRVWAGALTLIVIVMLLNLAARLIARWKAPARTSR